jgi:MinD superfamily P-loop ATPase
VRIIAHKPGKAVLIDGGLDTDNCEPLAATVVAKLPFACEGCGLPEYMCRTEAGMQFRFCHSVLRLPN